MSTGSGGRRLVEDAIRDALTGSGAHALTRDVFSGVDWKTAGARLSGAPHSLFQLANHMTYWNEWAVKWLQGRSPATPARAAGSWPGRVAPLSRREWSAAVSRFQRALDALERHIGRGGLLTARGGRSRVGMLHTIASHNSYHAGQAALVRVMLDAWPPPSGGLTW